jgi:hypothetical protein
LPPAVLFWRRCPRSPPVHSHSCKRENLNPKSDMFRMCQNWHHGAPWCAFDSHIDGQAAACLICSRHWCAIWAAGYLTAFLVYGTQCWWYYELSAHLHCHCGNAQATARQCCGRWC